MTKPKTVMMSVYYADGDHIWLGNQQYVSLKRFLEATNEKVVEMQELVKKVEELSKENEAMKVLLKDKFTKGE